MTRFFEIVSLLVIAVAGVSEGASAAALYPPRIVSGYVFEDRNANGVKDAGEKGIRNAGVSDGVAVVWTDRKGYYRMETASDKIFPITPDGWISAEGLLQNGAVSRIHGTGTFTADFGFVSVGEKKSFRVAVVGDVQVNSPDEIRLAGNTVIRELAGREDLDFVIHMGDLVNDKPSLFEDVLELWKLLPQPSWLVAGNHDLDTVDRSCRTADTFRRLTGNDVGAMFRGNKCFILLNNVERYEYAVSATQMEFMSNLVRHCGAGVEFVVCQHVPMSSVKNREEFLSIFDNRKLLILSAHAHHVFRKEWASNVSEVSVGASCGSWWTGERDMWGNPIALQQCGSPRNYFVFDFDSRGYSFSFKGIGLDETLQADAFFEGEKVIVNVYGGGESTTVEYRTGKGSWERMTKKDRLAPSVARMIALNKDGGYPTRFCRRTPLRKGGVSTHIWEAELPEKTSPVLYEFRVTDTRGLVPFLFCSVH